MRLQWIYYFFPHSYWLHAYDNHGRWCIFYRSSNVELVQVSRCGSKRKFSCFYLRSAWGAIENHRQIVVKAETRACSCTQECMLSSWERKRQPSKSTQEIVFLILYLGDRDTQYWKEPLWTQKTMSDAKLFLNGHLYEAKVFFSCLKPKRASCWWLHPETL